ncbi:MAG: DUF4169 family protein, partial [Pseudomonadota bacterium]
RRKQKAREAKKADANASAAVHGLTRAERDLKAARDAQAEMRLDGHKRQRPDPDDDR